MAGIGEILGDTKHEESWKQIQILEAPKPREPSPPPPEYPAPTFSTQIADIECDEGDASKFEASFMPNNDPYVKCQWVRNGVPLAHGSKYAISYDFGYCTLGIGYTFPEDEGLYQVVYSFPLCIEFLVPGFWVLGHFSCPEQFLQKQVKCDQCIISLHLIFDEY